MDEDVATANELEAAKQDFKDLVDILYNNIEHFSETEDDFDLDPHQNIIDNFSYKMQMACSKCKLSFVSWEDLDTHNSVHHEHETADQRVCTICDKMFNNWQERDTHMIMQHPIDSRTFQHAPAHKLTTLLCCSICSKHFIDEERWQTHYQESHGRYMGPRTFNWMITVCDIKGRGVVNDPDAKLYCTLCKREFPYNPDIFHFDHGHGKTQPHITAVQEFIAKTKTLPVKFLKVTNCANEIAGLFHPHELQSSCCCRTLACEFCGMHKSMVNKHPEAGIMLCTVCMMNIKWKNVESGIEHVTSEEHYKRLIMYVTKNGMQPEFNALFRKQRGEFISSVSFSR